MVNYEFRFAPLRQQIQSLIRRRRDRGGASRQRRPPDDEPACWSLSVPGVSIRRMEAACSTSSARTRLIDCDSGSENWPQFPRGWTLFPKRNWIRSSQARITSAPLSSSWQRQCIATLSMSWVTDPPLGTRIVVAGSRMAPSWRPRPAPCSRTAKCLLGRAGAGRACSSGLSRRSDHAAVAAGGADHRLGAARLRRSQRASTADESPSPNFEDGLQSQIAIEAMRESNGNRSDGPAGVERVNGQSAPFRVSMLIEVGSSMPCLIGISSPSGRGWSDQWPVGSVPRQMIEFSFQPL